MTELTETAPATPGAPADATVAGGVRLDGVSKRFGQVTAVDDITLDVRGGEFFALLGPSGSGKTTCLRMIAGFERPTSGRIVLAGRDVTDVPPFARATNTVFQDYALFPHMTVADNVGYGLMVKKVPKAQRRDLVQQALDTVRLGAFGDRRPSQLSGGQRQRVALARALVNRPAVLLLDEPLGALDRKLREEMQIELKSLQREVGITFLFVTHDQDEALTMSDRMAVFNNGRLEQVGTPREMYEHPQTAFVADFIGSSNILRGPEAQALLGEVGEFSIRPERIRLLADDEPARPGEHEVSGRLVDTVYAGGSLRRVVVTAAGPTLVVVERAVAAAAGPSAAGASRGQDVRLAWDAAAPYRIPTTQAGRHQ